MKNEIIGRKSHKVSVALSHRTRDRKVSSLMLTCSCLSSYAQHMCKNMSSSPVFYSALLKKE